MHTYPFVGYFAKQDQVKITDLISYKCKDDNDNSKSWILVILSPLKSPLTGYLKSGK